jgi:hypothetical protein
MSAENGTAAGQKRVRMVAFMYPKAGLSFEEIDKYWGKEHADVCLSVPLFKKNLLKYEQVRRRSPNEI